MRPYYDDGQIQIWHGDCREIVPALGERFAACVTDPPYGLTANKKGGSGVASVNLDSPYGRARIGTGNGPGGFMNQRWDGTGIERSVEFWSVVRDAMLPGAHLLSFGGTRTFHRIAVAIEDAGFEIRDTLQWIYGSGFPKSHNLKGDWQGWGTALKPAYEPIILARKPLVGTVAQNVLAHGTGALNIDQSRIAHQTVNGGNLADNPHLRTHINGGNGGHIIAHEPDRRVGQTSTAGRWPANVLLDEAAAAALDQMSGERKSGGVTHQPKRSGYGYRSDRDNGTSVQREPDTGGASRFFPVLPIDDPDALRFRYEPKASRRERNAGLDDLPERSASDRYPTLSSLNIDHQQRLPAQNHHPTVKPLALMRWLLTLVTPPAGVVLDPFAGSGTTGVAAAHLGIPCVLVEQEAEYLPIIAGRIDHAIDQRRVQDARPRQLSIAD